jgi:hypothetical protein
MPNALQWVGGANPAIATFEGEYDLRVENTKALANLFARKQFFCGCDFEIVTYREDENRLIFRSNVPAKNMTGVRDFLKTNIINHLGWTINQKELERYARALEEAIF